MRPTVPAAAARSIGPVVLAAGLFGPLFILKRFGPLDFWWSMAVSVTAVAAAAFLTDGSYARILASDLRGGVVRKVILGIGSSALLYIFFLTGDFLSRTILPFAASGIDHIYSFKAGASAGRIALLMTLIIGPGEEIFWRGFLQRNWQAGFGKTPGFLAAAGFYTLVHLGSGNVMLIAAAAVCALFWGAIYTRYRSVLLVAVSHTIWDLAVFLIRPF